MLPTLTRDFDQALSDVRQHGLALIADQLTEDQLKLARQATYAGAQQDIELSREADKFELDYGKGNVRVWNILNRHTVFQEMVQLPVVLKLLTEVIGWPALLSNISANIAKPGRDGGAWHQDQIYMPKPWSRKPQGIIHDDLDPSSFDERAESIIVPAGTLMVFESRVMHRTGCNRSVASRAAMFGFYTKPIYRPQENWFFISRSRGHRICIR